MYRRFDVDTYRAESAGWNVEKFVNVAAATGRHSVDETIELDRHAAAGGGPDAIVGAFRRPTRVAEAIAADRSPDGGFALPGGSPDGRHWTAAARSRGAPRPWPSGTWSSS